MTKQTKRQLVTLFLNDAPSFQNSRANQALMGNNSDRDEDEEKIACWKRRIKQQQKRQCQTNVDNLSQILSFTSLLLFSSTLFRLLKTRNNQHNEIFKTNNASRIFSEWFSHRIQTASNQSALLSRPILLMLLLFLTIVSAAGQEFGHVTSGRDHLNWRRIPLSMPSISRRHDDDGRNSVRPIMPYGRIDSRTPIMRYNWPDARPALIDNHRFAIPDAHRFQQQPLMSPYSPSSRPRLPFPSFPAQNTHSSPFTFPRRPDRRPHYSQSPQKRFDSHHWPEMPAMPEFPKKDNPLTARGMHFRKTANINSGDATEEGENEHPVSQLNHESNNKVLQAKNREKILKQPKEQEQENHQEEQEEQEETKEGPDSGNEKTEKVNSPVNNRHADDSDNEVISAAEEDNERLQRQSNKLPSSRPKLEQERRISRRRLSPIEYEPDDITQKQATTSEPKPPSEVVSVPETTSPSVSKNSDKQPALIATRLSELYPDHVEAIKRNQKPNNNSISLGVSKKSGDDSSVPPATVQSQSESGPKATATNLSAGRDNAESKLNTDSRLPSTNEITTVGDPDHRTMGGEKGVEGDKGKLVEKGYSNRDRGFGFVKAWAWDRAENYNVKEADHENDNKAKTLHDTKVLTSDRFMDKILKPSGLG